MNTFRASSPASLKMSKQPEYFQLTELVPDTNVDGPLRLYLYGADGRHDGGKWFQRVPEFPDEEITAAEAHRLFTAHLKTGHEIRITNTSDFLVLHAVKGKVVHPADPDAFWREVL